MIVTYLGHSGFLAETGSAYYVFDYIRGELPVFSGRKPLYVFVSHAHSDHWDPGIFTDPRLKGAEAFILGFDIMEPFEKMCREDPALAALPVLWAEPLKEIRTEEFRCLPLLSTDEGVAFPVCGKEAAVYHAGDLNWWHWNGDPAERNRERARNFKREIGRLNGVHIDAAFIPLDPRQEDAYRLCMDHCMETLDMDHVFPMHFWKNYELCSVYRESLRETHPDWYAKFCPVSFEGEQFSFPVIRS